jgi:hypothetical protein
MNPDQQGPGARLGVIRQVQVQQQVAVADAGVFDVEQCVHRAWGEL